jgi:hypothetical protein
MAFGERILVNFMWVRLTLYLLIEVMQLGCLPLAAGGLGQILLLY